MKEPIVTLGKNTLIYGIGTMLTRFIHLLLLPVFTRYLTPEDYGVIAILALLGFVAQPLFSLGFNASIGPCYFEGNNIRRKASAVWTAFAILLISSLLLTAVAWLFPSELSWIAFQAYDYSWFVSLYLFGVAFNIISVPFTLRLQFEQRATLFVVLTLISTFVTIGFSVYMVVFLRWGVEGVVWGRLIGQAVNFFLFMICSSLNMKFKIDLKIARELLRMGLPLVPSFAFLFILQQSNKYILQWFRGLDEVGIYSIGFNLGMVMNVLVGAFTTAWYPYFMSFMEKQDEAGKLFGTITTYYVLGCGSICILFFIAAKPVVMLMTQPAFYNAYIVIGFSALAAFFVGLFNLFLPGVYFSKELKYVSLMQGIAAVVSILMNLILIPPFGIFGAAIALAAGYAVMAIMQHLWNLNRREYYIKIVYDWRRVSKFMSIFIFISLLSIIYRRFTLNCEITLSIILFLLFILTISKILNTNEKKMLFSLIRKHNLKILR